MKTERAKQAEKVQTTDSIHATRRAPYSPPRVEVIKMEMEGSVMSASNFGGADAFSLHNTGTYSSPGRRTYNSATTSDLEDLINDILTIEQ